MRLRRDIEAVAALADALYVARRVPGFADGFDAPRLADRLAALTVAEAPVVNPLVDWAHLAAAAGADAGANALAVLADYAVRGLAADVSPHPLLRACLNRRGSDVGSDEAGWVAAALADADADGRTLVPILDPGFVLDALGARPEALQDYGFRSVGRFYLAEGVPRGVPPCAAFDPVFVLAVLGAPVRLDRTRPPAVLSAALAAYLEAMEEGRAPSPSAVFDEAFVRARHASIAAEVEQAAGSALAAWLAAGRPPIARTASGLEHFPEAMPHPWWERERQAAARRGRRRVTPARLAEEAVDRVRAADPAALAVRVEAGLPAMVFAGERLTLTAHGLACCPGGEVVTVALKVGGRVFAQEPFQAFPRAEAFARETGLVSAGAQLFGGFAVAWSGPAPAVGRHPVTLVVGVRARSGEGDGNQRTTEREIALGTLDVHRRRAARRATTRTPAVAIAMATFEPPAALFEAQLQSIRAQTAPDWQLTISDESETEAARALVDRLTRGDPRITVLHGPRHGVVGNFERALRAVEAAAPFVALADQDDRWEPDKLDRLISRMGDGVALVHGAMRLVDPDGRPLPGVAPTARLVDPTLLQLLAENEVTGASALLRADVIEAALPMPRLPGLFHDHWLALVARSLGRIVFEPAVVQDYVQHGGNVVGEDPRRDRAAAGRLARERRGFERCCAMLDDTGGRPAPAALEQALLPAAFSVVSAALLRVVALDALPEGLQTAGPGGATGVARLAALPVGGGLSVERLAAFGRALKNGDAAPSAGRLGVASWLAAGLAAIEAARRSPDLLAAAAGRHHRRAVAAIGAGPAVNQPLPPRHSRARRGAADGG